MSQTAFLVEKINQSVTVYNEVIYTNRTIE